MSFLLSFMFIFFVCLFVLFSVPKKSKKDFYYFLGAQQFQFRVVLILIQQYDRVEHSNYWDTCNGAGFVLQCGGAVRDADRKQSSASPDETVSF